MLQKPRPPHRTYTRASAAALVAVFTFAGPLCGALPVAVMIAIAAVAKGELVETLPQILLFAYGFGGPPAFVAGIAMLSICRRDHDNALPRAWAAAVIGVFTALAAIAAATLPGADASLAGIGALAFGLTFVTLICALPAATACWWLAKRLGILTGGRAAG